MRCVGTEADAGAPPRANPSPNSNPNPNPNRHPDPNPYLPLLYLLTDLLPGAGCAQRGGAPGSPAGEYLIAMPAPGGAARKLLIAI